MPDKKLTNNLSNNSPMFSNSLPDNEIVKGMEWCKSNTLGKCKKCSLEYTEFCCEDVPKAIFDLINRLQAENERLKETIEVLRPVVEQSHIIRKDGKSPLYLLTSEIEAEAYKEFAELLHCQCESIINQPHNENVRPISWKVAYEEFDEKVANLLKELVVNSNVRT